MGCTVSVSGQQRVQGAPSLSTTGRVSPGSPTKCGPWSQGGPHIRGPRPASEGEACRPKGGGPGDPLTPAASAQQGMAPTVWLGVRHTC